MAVSAFAALAAIASLALVSNQAWQPQHRLWHQNASGSACVNKTLVRVGTTAWPTGAVV
jgi:hypothetical protein